MSNKFYSTEEQVRDYEERTFQFDETGDRMDRAIRDRELTPARVLAGIIRLPMGKGFTDIPLVGIHPVARSAVTTGLQTIGAGATSKPLTGNFSKRAVGIKIWNFDVINGLFLTVNSSDGGFDGLYIGPQTLLEEDISLAGDTQMIVNNRSTASIQYQMYMKGF